MRFHYSEGKNDGEERGEEQSREIEGKGKDPDSPWGRWEIPKEWAVRASGLTQITFPFYLLCPSAPQE